MGSNCSSTSETTGHEPTDPKSRIGVKLLVLPNKESQSNVIKYYNVTK